MHQEPAFYESTKSIKKKKNYRINVGNFTKACFSGKRTQRPVKWLSIVRNVKHKILPNKYSVMEPWNDRVQRSKYSMCIDSKSEEFEKLTGDDIKRSGMLC